MASPKKNAFEFQIKQEPGIMKNKDTEKDQSSIAQNLANSHQSEQEESKLDAPDGGINEQKLMLGMQNTTTTNKVHNTENDLSPADTTDWKRKFTLLLAKSDSVEKFNLQLINRLYACKRMTRRSIKEREYLMKKLDGYQDSYRTYKNLYFDNRLLHEHLNNTIKRTSLNQAQAIQHKPPPAAAKNPVKKNRKPTAAGHRNPLEPKKPMNAFLRYCREERGKVIEREPELTNQELTRTLGLQWNSLDKETKQRYYTSFERDKVRYEREIADQQRKKRLQKKRTINENECGESESDSDMTDETASNVASPAKGKTSSGTKTKASPTKLKKKRRKDESDAAIKNETG